MILFNLLGKSAIFGYLDYVIITNIYIEQNEKKNLNIIV
ncbi:mercury resistance system transport protein MerF [Bacillus sp. DJP31]